MSRRAMLLVSAFAAGCASSPESDADSRPAGPPIPVEIVGADEIDADDLLDAARLELEAFQTRGRRSTELDDAADAMLRYLREEARAHATVEFRALPSEDAVERVVFEVHEGPRTALLSVAFEGNTAHASEELARFFQFREKDEKDEEDDEPVTYRKRELDAAVSDVESVYLADGYYRATVGPARTTWNEARTEASVVVPVEEGRRYVVKEVDFAIEGPAPMSPLAQRVKEFEGKPFSARTPAEIASVVRGELAGEGRLLMEVLTRRRVDDETAEATITVRVRPGPQVEVRRLAVAGNDRTDADFILDQSNLEAGRILTQEALDAAIDGLYNTGLFKTVRVDRDPQETESDVAPTDLTVAVEEFPARSVDFEIGYGSYEQLRAAVRYRDRNLFGRGRMLEAVPRASFRSYGADLKYFDNYLLGRTNTVEVTMGHLSREEPSFDYTAAGAEVAIRRRIGTGSSVRFGHRLRYSTAADINVNVPADQAGDNSLISSPFVEYEFDTRDDVFLPTSGVFATGGVAWSSPAFGGDLDYFETVGTLSSFLALGDDTVLATNLRARNREILDDRTTLPIQERFFLGGENSVRSFYESELGPTDGQGNPIGGLMAVEGSVELRQKLTGDLYGALFYDIGTVSPKSFDFSGPYGHAVGVGLRYLLPFGPIRLDFGWNPGRRFAADQSWALQFGFGFSF
jgi:outer membrane protein insertion porin family